MGTRLKIDKAYRQRLAEAGLDTVPKVLATPVADLEGSGQRYAQYEVNGQASQPTLYVKRFHYADWPTRFNFLGRCFFGRSRAQREWRRLRLMHKLGIQSSRPLARGEKRIFGFLVDCYLVTEGVPASDSLRDFAVRYFHKAASPRGRELKQAILSQLADQIQLMHSKHFYHGELTWDNILIRPTPAGEFEFFFINALRGRRVFVPWKRARLRARDLAGIDAVPDEFMSTCDKIRFLKRYLDQDEVSDRQREWMRLIQRIAGDMFASRSTYTTARPAEPPSTANRQETLGVHH
ncbi:MAG: hypothetical protein BIFFINMI_03432 [Phycisphaerae bacterium]|nr:hypothetical protein [Phycisphaerae bacterium]